MIENSKGNNVINVFKPKGITSQSVVTAVKRALNVKKAGHCGTLDPLATGVLPVMINRAVKASEFLTDHDKLYIARMKLGVVTDTGDITGNVLSVFEGKLPDFSEILSILPEFIGRIIQVPPMYSALKVDGQKLVDLARRGIEIDRKGREIEIYSLSAEASGEEIILKVLCSRGTYIRTLIEDMGKALGCGATMTALCRSAVGTMENGAFYPMFSEENAVDLETLKRGELPECSVVNVEEVYHMYDKISFPKFYSDLFLNGCEIYLSKLDKNHPAKNANLGDVFRFYYDGEFIALGEVKEYENGIAFKQVKRF